jgi:hypothetical protein
MISHFRLSLRSFTARKILFSTSRRTMATSDSFSAIADSLKFDIVSQTHALENAAKRKEISRTFICKLR